jgi:hypothetical protein
MDPTILQSLRGHGRRGARPAPALLALDSSRAYLSQPDMQLRGRGGTGRARNHPVQRQRATPRAPPPRRRGRGRRCRGRGALRIGAGRPRRPTRRRRSPGLARGRPHHLYEQYVDEAGYQPGEVPDGGLDTKPAIGAGNVTNPTPSQPLARPAARARRAGGARRKESPQKASGAAGLLTPATRAATSPGTRGGAGRPWRRRLMR